MTFNELYAKFNDEFGLDDWPVQYEVDSDTYAHVCAEIFKLANAMVEASDRPRINRFIHIYAGQDGGILFKGVELILKENK